MWYATFSLNIFKNIKSWKIRGMLDQIVFFIDNLFKSAQTNIIMILWGLGWAVPVTHMYIKVTLKQLKKN